MKLLIQQTKEGFKTNCTIPSIADHIYSTEKTVGEAICFILGVLSSEKIRKIRYHLRLETLRLEGRQLTSDLELEITEERRVNQPDIFFACENTGEKIEPRGHSEDLLDLLDKLLDPAHGHETIVLNLLTDVDLRCDAETQAAFSRGYSAVLEKK
jgi:hypothetical protein